LSRRIRNEGLVKVWDLPVRLFHGALVVVVLVAGLTETAAPTTWLGVHIVAGYTLAGLLAARLVWALLGSEFSRFDRFVLAPRAVLGHLRDLLTGRPSRHLGHNPAGSAMIVALLVVLTALVVTGLVTLGGMFKQGPLAPLLPFAVGSPARQIHNVLLYLLLILIALHLIGVALESALTRENLARAMIDGLKRDAAWQEPPVHRQSRPGWALAAVVLLVGGAGTGLAALAALPAYGVRPVPHPPDYAESCGACHFAFPPTLLPAAAWTSLMSHLDRHFGENASLDAASVTAIRGYLADNAAESSDNLTAHMFRQVDPAEPERITATAYWQRRHRSIPEATFRSAAVGSKAMCNACHRDAAEGAFAPQQIHVPEVKP
jgi:cytochrome b